MGPFESARIARRLPIAGNVQTDSETVMVTWQTRAILELRAIVALGPEQTVIFYARFSSGRTRRICRRNVAHG